MIRTEAPQMNPTDNSVLARRCATCGSFLVLPGDGSHKCAKCRSLNCGGGCGRPYEDHHRKPGWEWLICPHPDITQPRWYDGAIAFRLDPPGAGFSEMKAAMEEFPDQIISSYVGWLWRRPPEDDELIPDPLGD